MTLITDAHGNPYPLLIDDGSIPNDAEIPVATVSGNRAILLEILRFPPPNLTDAQKNTFRQRLGIATNSTALADMPSQLTGGARHLLFVDSLETSYELSLMQATDIPANAIDESKIASQTLLLNHLNSTNSPFARGIPVGNTGANFTHSYVEDLIAGTKTVGYIPTLSSLGRLTYQSGSERQFTPVQVGTYTNTSPIANTMYSTGITLPNVSTEWYLWSLPSSENPDWHLINGIAFGSLSPRGAGSGTLSTTAIGLVTGISVRTVYFARTSSNEVLAGASHGDVAFNPLTFLRWVDPTVADNFVRPGHGIVYVTPGQVSGTNTIILVPAPAFTTYAQGVSLSFVAENHSTGVVNVNVNGLGLRELHDIGGRVSAGDIVAGTTYLIQDDGTYFQILARSDGTETGDVIKNKLEALSGSARLSASAIRDLPSLVGGETASSIRTKLEGLLGNDRLSATAIRDLPTPPTAETGSTIKAKLETLAGTSRLLASAIEGLPTVETGSTIRNKLQALSGSSRLDASAIQNLPGDENAASIRTKLETLMADARLDATAIKNLPSAETGAEIRTKLETLTGNSRLSATAIRDLPDSAVPETGTTIKTKLEMLTGSSRLLASAVQGLPTIESGATIKTKLELLSGNSRLQASAVQGIPAAETAVSVRDKLQTLSLADRLDASAIKNLPEPGSASDGLPLPLLVAAIKTTGTPPSGAIQGGIVVGNIANMVWVSNSSESTDDADDFFTVSADGTQIDCVRSGHVEISGTVHGRESTQSGVQRAHVAILVQRTRSGNVVNLYASDELYQRSDTPSVVYGQSFGVRLEVEAGDVLRTRIRLSSGTASAAPILDEGRLTVAWQAAIPGPTGPAGASTTSSPTSIRDSLQTLTGSQRLLASAIQGLPAADTGATIKTKLEALSGDSRLDVSAIKDLPAAETGTTIKTKLEGLSGNSRLDASAIQNLPTPTSSETGTTIKTKLEALTGTNRLIASAIQGIPAAETASTIRDKLQSLATTSRLSASAIQGIPAAETGSTIKSKLELLSGNNRLLASAIQGLPASETGSTIKNKLESLTGASRLDASAIQNLPAPTSTETGTTIRTKLETLIGNNRLSAASIRDLPAVETGATIKGKLEGLTGSARLTTSAIEGLPDFTNLMQRTNATTGTMWRQVTRDQYDALSDADKMNGTYYMVETP